MVKRVASVGHLHPFYYRLTLQKVTNLADLNSITSKGMPSINRRTTAPQAELMQTMQKETPSGLVQTAKPEGVKL
jgi:hypothetical protein